MSAPRIALLSLAALAALPACRTKTDQCNAFIDQASAAEKAIEGVTDYGDPERLKADATRIEGQAKAVGDVKLDDARLKELQGKYVANLGLYAKNLRATAAAKSDEAELEKLEKEDDQIQKDGSQLIDDINVYCTGHK